MTKVLTGPDLVPLPGASSGTSLKLTGPAYVVMGVDEAQDGGANLGTSCDLGRSSQPGERALSRRTREVVLWVCGQREEVVG